MATETTCRLCGEMLPEPKKTGRPREYCPDTCKPVAVAISLLTSRLLKWGPKVPQRARDRVRGEIQSGVNSSLGKADAKS